MGIFRSIKIRLLIFGLSISLIPISIITTIYYLNTRRALKSHELQKMAAIAESKRIHTLSFLDAKKGRVIDFSSDIFNQLEMAADVLQEHIHFFLEERS